MSDIEDESEVEKLKRICTSNNEMMHLMIRQMQAAYAAGMRSGPEACMVYIRNALAGPGLIPFSGADPDWYCSDAWPPFATVVPFENATINDGRHFYDDERSYGSRAEEKAAKK